MPNNGQRGIVNFLGPMQGRRNQQKPLSAQIAGLLLDFRYPSGFGYPYERVVPVHEMVMGLPCHLPTDAKKCRARCPTMGSALSVNSKEQCGAGETNRSL